MTTDWHCRYLSAAALISCDVNTHVNVPWVHVLMTHVEVKGGWRVNTFHLSLCEQHSNIVRLVLEFNRETEVKQSPTVTLSQQRWGKNEMAPLLATLFHVSNSECYWLRLTYHMFCGCLLDAVWWEIWSTGFYFFLFLSDITQMKRRKTGWLVYWRCESQSQLASLKASLPTFKKPAYTQYF